LGVDLTTRPRLRGAEAAPALINSSTGVAAMWIVRRVCFGGAGVCSGATARTDRSVCGKALRRWTRRYSSQRDEFYRAKQIRAYLELVPEDAFPTLSPIFVETLCRNAVENAQCPQSPPTKFSTKFLKTRSWDRPSLARYRQITSIDSNQK